MLLAFRVANYRSIRDEQELSFVATGFNERTAVEVPIEPKGTIKVLPVEGIYGKNASGKSNVLRALQSMFRLVRSADVHRDRARYVDFQQTPFLLEAGPRGRPTRFEVELLLRGVRYVYGFEFGEDMVRSEWLHAYPNGRRQVWFDRAGPVADDFRFPGDHLKGPKATLVELVRPEALLLGLVSRVVIHPQLEPIADWFRWGMSSRIGRDVGLARYRRELDLARFLSGRYGDRARELIGHADLGLRDAVVIERSVGDKTEARVQLHHACASGEIALPLQEESEGTVSWLLALQLILPALDKGRILLFDELTANLHPQLAAEVIRMFQDPRVNDRTAQLVFTSHDVSMLGTQFGAPLLDRDQIWFTEKGDDGATELYPVTDLKPRKGENIEHGYLSGRYGAAPDLSPGEIGRALRRVRERESA
ncbi:MAG: AAA family ATPase [Micromonosporaceae bacterium]